VAPSQDPEKDGRNYGDGSAARQHVPGLADEWPPRRDETDRPRNYYVRRNSAFATCAKQPRREDGVLVARQYIPGAWPD